MLGVNRARSRARGRRARPESSGTTTQATFIRGAAATNYNRVAKSSECASFEVLRRLNNYIKATLFNVALQETVALPRPLKVLDIGCGRGGDINKWAIHIKDQQIDEYRGCDIAADAVREAMRRASVKSPYVRNRMQFHVADGMATLRRAQNVSIVSAMLVANYLIVDTAELDAFLVAADAALAVGGILLMTFLDWDAVEAVYAVGQDVPFITPQSDGTYEYNLPGLVDHVAEFPLRMKHVCNRARLMTALMPVECGTNPELYRKWSARTDLTSVRTHTNIMGTLPAKIDADTALRFGLYAGVCMRKVHRCDGQRMEQI